MWTWLDEVVSAGLRRPSKRAQEQEVQRYWDERRAIAEMLAARGYEPVMHPYFGSSRIYAMGERELQFIRAGTAEPFVAKWAYMHPATNVADLWWRLPRLGDDDKRALN